MAKRKEQPIEVKKERLFTISMSFITLMYIILIAVVLFFIWVILYFDHLRIEIIGTENAKYETYTFSILVSIMLILFLVACGFFIDIQKNYWRFVFVVIIIYLIYLGFTYISLRFTFNTNLGLLNYEVYDSGTKKGVKFFVLNFYPFWFFVWIISLLFESEK